MGLIVRYQDITQKLNFQAAMVKLRKSPMGPEYTAFRREQEYMSQKHGKRRVKHCLDYYTHLKPKVTSLSLKGQGYFCSYALLSFKG